MFPMHNLGSDHVARAAALAQEIDDVREVTSRLKVESKNP